MDRLSLNEDLEVGLLQAKSLTMLEQRMDIIALIDAQRAESNEAEVIDDTITSHEANGAEVVDDVVRYDVEAHDKDYPIAPTADAGDEEDEDEHDDDEDEDDSPSLPNTGKDLDGDDDEDEDNDDFTIQYHKPASDLKGFSLKDSSS
ncbi:prothymosin alpha-B-like [Cynara cardunculus var. scolymus]|uniref:prothymosin alpha-B-like n=1 Tax=Cynara cardunculus var. scolymus TaxID=59895 RepID=UPI000D6234F9|nr:prothymosin alpha-B-like [Cynara cardunculus var. scolymus]